MYISEWDAPGGGLPLSNIRVTTKVAVNALLGDSPDLVNYGSALMANLGDKEVKAVVCILQFSIKSLLYLSLLSSFLINYVFATKAIVLFSKFAKLLKILNNALFFPNFITMNSQKNSLALKHLYLI